MYIRSNRVATAIEEARSIHEAIDAVARIQDRAILQSMEFNISSESDMESDTESDFDTSDDEDLQKSPKAGTVNLPSAPGGTAGVGMQKSPKAGTVNIPSAPGGTAGVGMQKSPKAGTVNLPSAPGGTAGVGTHRELVKPITAGAPFVAGESRVEELEEVLRSSHFNCFFRVDYIERMEHETLYEQQYLDEFYHYILPRLGCSERALLQQSYQAFKVSMPHSD